MLTENDVIQIGMRLRAAAGDSSVKLDSDTSEEQFYNSYRKEVARKLKEKSLCLSEMT